MEVENEVREKGLYQWEVTGVVLAALSHDMAYIFQIAH